MAFDPDFYSSEADGGAGYVFFDTDDLTIIDSASIDAISLIPGGEPAGSSPDNPLLPTDGDGGPDSPWRFDVPGDVILQFFPGTIWVDPEVAVGFEYEVLTGPSFASVTAPSGFGDDLYELLLIDPGNSQFVPVATLAASRAICSGATETPWPMAFRASRQRAGRGSSAHRLTLAADNNGRADGAINAGA